MIRLLSIVFLLLLYLNAYSSIFFINLQDELEAGYKQRNIMMVIDDPEQLSRILIIGGKLSEVSRKRKGIDYNFSLIKDVNAYSGYAGFIYVGLPFLELFNDDELAFVIAHEMAHADNRDTTNSIEKEASKKYKDQDKKISITDDILVGYHYDRIQEYRADSQAILYMYLAGYDVNAGVTVMDKFQTTFGAYSPGMEKVSDHPSNISRKRNIESFIKELNYVNKYILNDANQAYRSGNYADAIKYYSQYLSFFYNSFVGYYYRGISHLKRSENNSDGKLNWLVKNESIQSNKTKDYNNLILSINDLYEANRLEPNNLDILNFIGILNSERGNYTEAKKYFNDALKLNINSCDTLNNLGLLSYKQKNIKESINYLNQANNLCSNNKIILKNNNYVRQFN